MDRYKEIREIIITSSKSELNSIEAHIASMPAVSTSHVLKSNDFIKAVSEFPEKSEVEILKSIGFNTKTENLSVFYRATRNLIHEALLLDINLDKQFEYSNSFRNKATGRKKLILSEIFLKKGLLENANFVLDEIISRSTKYEEIDQVIESYELLKLKSILNSDVKEYDQIDQKLSELEEQRVAIHTAQKHYQNVTLHASLPLPKAFKAAIDNGLKEVKQVARKTDLHKVTYFLWLIECESLKLQKDYAGAITKYRDVLDIVRSKAPLQSTEREAQILLKIARCEVLTENYKKAKEVYNEAANLFKKSDYEHYLISANLMYLDFYTGNYNEIKSLLDLRSRSRYITSLPYATAQYEFFNGAFLYLKDKPLNAVKFLAPKAKPSSNIPFETQLGINFLLLISGIDILGSQPKLAETTIAEAFQNMEEIKASHTLSKRDKLLIRIFKKLKARNFDFEITLPVIEDNLKDLQSNADYKWTPFSHEIVRMDEWFNSKNKKAVKPTKTVKAPAKKKPVAKRTAKA